MKKIIQQKKRVFSALSLFLVVFFSTTTLVWGQSTRPVSINDLQRPKAPSLFSQYFDQIVQATLDIAGAIPAYPSTKALLDNAKNISSAAKTIYATSGVVDAMKKDQAAISDFTETASEALIPSVVDEIKRAYIDLEAYNNIYSQGSQLNISIQIQRFADLESRIGSLSPSAMSSLASVSTTKLLLLEALYLRSPDSNAMNENFYRYITGVNQSIDAWKKKIIDLDNGMNKKMVARIYTFRCGPSNPCDAKEFPTTHIGEVAYGGTWERLHSRFENPNTTAGIQQAQLDADELKRRLMERERLNVKNKYKYNEILNAFEQIKDHALIRNTNTNLSRGRTTWGNYRNGEWAWTVDLGFNRLLDSVVINQKNYLNNAMLKLPATGFRIEIYSATNINSPIKTFNFPKNSNANYYHQSLRLVNNAPTGPATAARFVRFIIKANETAAINDIVQSGMGGGFMRVHSANLVLGKGATILFSRPNTQMVGLNQVTDGVTYNPNRPIPEQILPIWGIFSSSNPKSVSVQPEFTENVLLSTVRLTGVMSPGVIYPEYAGRMLNLAFSYYDNNDRMVLQSNKTLPANQINIVVDRAPMDLNIKRVVISTTDGLPLNIGEIEIYKKADDALVNGL
jgi:hypothetical protein